MLYVFFLLHLYYLTFTLTVLHFNTVYMIIVVWTLLLSGEIHHRKQSSGKWGISNWICNFTRDQSERKKDKSITSGMSERERKKSQVNVCPSEQRAVSIYYNFLCVFFVVFLVHWLYSCLSFFVSTLGMWVECKHEERKRKKKVSVVAFVKKCFTVVISTAGASVTYHGGRRKKRRRRRKRERQMVHGDSKSRLSERCMLSTLLVFSCVLLSVSFIAFTCPSFLFFLSFSSCRSVFIQPEQWWPHQGLISMTASTRSHAFV